VIQVDHRDELQAHLGKAGIGTAIHYPVPIHLQPAAASLGRGMGDFPVTENHARRILTLPVHQRLREDQIKRVAATVNQFLESKNQ
jgi:dTDP-4-amino-4,6-dideoxygalactose transaminase